MLETLSEYRCFEGTQGFYRHASEVVGLPMRFGVFQPPQAKHRALPTLLYLSGLTCTEETFFLKAGAQRLAAQLGLLLVSCDTSPRNTGISGESDDWEFGSGAGFYVNATLQPWAQHYRMYDYVRDELPRLLYEYFPARPGVISIFGHSMGGHGALVLALRNPQLYRSVSAFAPICAPSRCPWGLKAFPRYLGEDSSTWMLYDAVELMTSKHAPPFADILIDQGLSDKFLQQSQLLPEVFEQACADVGQRLHLRKHIGYDHGYYFISTFMEDHLRFHAAALDA